MIGEALGNYRLVAKLGSGSMGVVFLAEHQRIARRVAIKLLAPELARNQQALERFFNEARAASLIRHPGIVEVFDCGIDAKGRAYMVMEHLVGETLADRLRRAGRLHWTAACLVARQVADALGAVHDNGIVHRDLKPENVFLTGGPREAAAAAVKVLDFGVAKLLAVDAAGRLTTRGMPVGTPEYMSPEQCGGSQNVDHRADIYALGCILFELLTGQPPFVTAKVQELIAAHRFRPAPSLAASASEVPVWLGDLLARMLSKEPDQRPSSMHDVTQVLRAHKAPEPVVAPIVVVRASATDAGAGVDPPEVPATVLLVDDDPAIRSAVKDFLHDEGYTVVSATNGADALNVLRTGLRADVILLDIMMPEMDGWDFRATQLADPVLRDIPVVVISASGVAPDTIRQQLEAYDVLSKPLELEHFLQTLKAACGLVDSEPSASR